MQPAPNHIVLATFGSLGDLYPFLSLGQLLIAEGHSVTIATHACYQDRIPAGLQFQALRPDLPEDVAFHAKFMDARTGSRFAIRDYLAPAIDATYHDLLAACTKADLLISQSLVLAAPLVARTQSIKWLSAAFQPFAFFSAHDPSLLRIRAKLPLRMRRSLLYAAKRWTQRWILPVLQLRDRLDVPDYGQPLFDGQFSPLGTLALFPPTVGSPQPDWPPQVTQASLASYQSQTTLPADVSRFLQTGEPPLIFTLGSASVRKPSAFFRTAQAIAEALGMRAVLLGDTSMTSLPPTIMRCGFAPYPLIFPHAAVIVHSGGIGTCTAALTAGKPQLIVPLAHDQHDNARRMTKASLARVIPFRKFTRRRGVAALQALLHKPLPDRDLKQVQPDPASVLAAINRALP